MLPACNPDASATFVCAGEQAHLLLAVSLLERALDSGDAVHYAFRLHLVTLYTELGRHACRRAAAEGVEPKAGTTAPIQVGVQAEAETPVISRAHLPCSRALSFFAAPPAGTFMPAYLHFQRLDIKHVQRETTAHLVARPAFVALAFPQVKARDCSPSLLLFLPLGVAPPGRTHVLTNHSSGFSTPSTHSRGAFPGGSAPLCASLRPVDVACALPVAAIYSLHSMLLRHCNANLQIPSNPAFRLYSPPLLSLSPRFEIGPRKARTAHGQATSTARNRSTEDTGAKKRRRPHMRNTTAWLRRRREALRRNHSSLRRTDD